MARRDKSNNDSVITPEGEARLRHLVEGSARKLREGEERWEASQKRARAENQGDISKNISESISENISEKRRGFFDIPNDIPNTLPSDATSSRLKLPPPVLHRVTPTKQTRGRPSYSGAAQQAIIKALLKRGLAGTTYKQLNQQTGVAQPNITRIVKALLNDGFIEKAVDKANRNVLIPLDILKEIVDEPGGNGQDISESISENISHIISLNPSECSELESKNHSLPSEVEEYQNILDSMPKERWKELYPFLEQIGVSQQLVAKAFSDQRTKGMANVQIYQRALLKCEFEAQRVVENGYQVLDKKGQPVKSLVAFYRTTLSAYGEYRNPEGWEDPELARNRELVQLADKLQVTREEGMKKLFAEWQTRLLPTEKTKLLAQEKKKDKGLEMVSDEMALRMIFEKSAPLFVRAMEADMFSALPQGYLEETEP